MTCEEFVVKKLQEDEITISEQQNLILNLNNKVKELEEYIHCIGNMLSYSETSENKHFYLSIYDIFEEENFNQLKNIFGDTIKKEEE